MELCLTRVLRDMRQESGGAKPLDSGLVQTQSLGETSENGEEEKDDPFSFLQQDLFENASLQDCENEMKEKLGDEGFCFVIQVSDRSPFILVVFQLLPRVSDASYRNGCSNTLQDRLGSPGNSKRLAETYAIHGFFRNVDHAAADKCGYRRVRCF